MFLYKLLKKFSFVHDLTAVSALLSGRGSPRGVHTFGRANFPVGRGFHPRGPGHGGRMGFTERDFGSPYPPFRGRSNFGRGNENNKLFSSLLKMKLTNFVPLSPSLLSLPFMLTVLWEKTLSVYLILMSTQLNKSQRYYYTLFEL